MTLRVYSHADEERSREAAGAFAQAEKTAKEEVEGEGSVSPK